MWKLHWNLHGAIYLMHRTFRFPQRPDKKAKSTKLRLEEQCEFCRSNLTVKRSRLRSSPPTNWKGFSITLREGNLWTITPSLQRLPRSGQESPKREFNCRL